MFFVFVKISGRSGRERLKEAKKKYVYAVQLENKLVENGHGSVPQKMKTLGQ